MKIKLKHTSKTLYKAHREFLNANRINLSEITQIGYNQRYLSLNKYGLDDELDVAMIDTAMVNQFINNMQSHGLASETMNNYLSYLKILMTFCEDMGYIDKMPKFKTIKNTTQQKMPLTHEEIEKLIVMPKDLDFVTYRNWVQCQLMLATGIRSRNVREVKVSDLNLAHSTLFLADTKNGNAYTINLSPTIVKLLTSYVSRLELDDTMPLFPTQYGKVQHRGSFANSMTKFFKMQGVERATPHLLRHTYASQLAKSNVPIPIISKMLCHANLRTTSRYINMMEDDVREVARTIDILGSYQPKKRSRIKL